jgi:hypothetical protein
MKKRWQFRQRNAVYWAFVSGRARDAAAPLAYGTVIGRLGFGRITFAAGRMIYAALGVPTR